MYFFIKGSIIILIYSLKNIFLIKKAQARLKFKRNILKKYLKMRAMKKIRKN